MLLGGAPETAKDLQAAQQLKQRFGCGPRSYWSQALLFDAPCAASRFFRVPSPQRRGTAPALLSAQTGRRLWRGARTSTYSGGESVRHNPSLNHRTPNGGLSWPGLGYAVHFPSPGQAIPPSVSG